MNPKQTLIMIVIIMIITGKLNQILILIQILAIVIQITVDLLDRVNQFNEIHYSDARQLKPV